MSQERTDQFAYAPEKVREFLTNLIEDARLTGLTPVNQKYILGDLLEAHEEIDRLNAVIKEQSEYIDAINKASDGLDTAVYLHMCHIDRLNAVITELKAENEILRGDIADNDEVQHDLGATIRDLTEQALKHAGQAHFGAREGTPMKRVTARACDALKEIFKLIKEIDRFRVANDKLRSAVKAKAAELRQEEYKSQHLEANMAIYHMHVEASIDRNMDTIYKLDKAQAQVAEADAWAEYWRREAFRQHPTQDAYDAACAALDKHRARADAGDKEIDRLRAENADKVAQIEHMRAEAQRLEPKYWELTTIARDRKADIERLNSVIREEKDQKYRMRLTMAAVASDLRELDEEGYGGDIVDRAKARIEAALKGAE